MMALLDTNPKRAIRGANLFLIALLLGVFYLALKRFGIELW